MTKPTKELVGVRPFRKVIADMQRIIASVDRMKAWKQ